VLGSGEQALLYPRTSPHESRSIPEELYFLGHSSFLVKTPATVEKTRCRAVQEKISVILFSLSYATNIDLGLRAIMSHLIITSNKALKTQRRIPFSAFQGKLQVYSLHISLNYLKKIFFQYKN